MLPHACSALLLALVLLLLLALVLLLLALFQRSHAHAALLRSVCALPLLLRLNYRRPRHLGDVARLIK